MSTSIQPAARMVETDGTIRTIDGSSSLNRLNDDGDYEEAHSTLMNNPSSMFVEEIDVDSTKAVMEDSRARLVTKYLLVHFSTFLILMLLIPIIIGCSECEEVSVVFYILFALWWLATTGVELRSSQKMRPSLVSMMMKYGNSDSVRLKVKSDFCYYCLQKLMETLFEINFLFIVITLLLIWDSSDPSLVVKFLSMFSFAVIVCLKVAGFIQVSLILCGKGTTSGHFEFVTMLGMYRKASLLYATGFKNFKLVDFDQIKYHGMDSFLGYFMFLLSQIIYAAGSSCNGGVLIFGILINIVAIMFSGVFLANGYTKSRSYFLCRKKFQFPFVRISHSEFESLGSVFYSFLKTSNVYSVIDFSDTNLQSSDIQRFSANCTDNVIEIHMDSLYKLELGALDTLLALLKRFSKLQCIYFGERSGFIKEGTGRGYFKNGDYYEGIWRRDNIDGRGKLVFSNGTSYEGFLEKGIINGSGKLFRADTSLKYEGDWNDGKRNGMGVSYFTNGHKYEGEWKGDKMEGGGRMVFPNGDILEGIWKDGHITGKAVRHYVDQSKFEGHFVDGEINGRGKFYYSNGEVSEGVFTYKIHKYPSGEMYEGLFKNEKREGHGRFYQSNGEVYEGQWKEDQKHSAGTQYRSDQTIKYNGDWTNNVADDIYEVDDGINFKYMIRPEDEEEENAKLVSEIMQTSSQGPAFKMISGGFDTYAYLWASDKPKFLRAYRGHETWINALHIATSNEILVTGGQDGALVSYQVKDGVVLAKVSKAHGKQIEAVTMTHDDKLVVSSGADSLVKVWQLDNLISLRTLDVDADRVTSLLVTSDDLKLFGGDSNGVLNVWNMITGAEIKSELLVDDDGGITTLALQETKNLIAIGSGGGTVRLHYFDSLMQIYEFEGHLMYISVVVFNSEGTRLISGSLDKTIKVWDIATKTLHINISNEGAAINDLDVVPDSDLLLAVGLDSTMKVYDSITGELNQSIPGHKSGVKCVKIFETSYE